MITLEDDFDDLEKIIMIESSWKFLCFLFSSHIQVFINDLENYSHFFEIVNIDLIADQW